MVSPSNLKHFDELDLFSLPLTGRSLIEASAGTGKTYSLAFIYLRLLLGIGKNNYPRPLSVENILVVTFTKAATEELRYRIRQNIHQLRLACITGAHADPDYQALIALIDDKPLALKRLLYAEQNMDEAAIFTIHSFCQRILTTYAFESGILFNQTLVKDQTEIYLQVANDIWRDNFTPMPEDIAYIIWQNWADPKALLTDIFPYLNQTLPSNVTLSTQPLTQVIKQFHAESIARIQAIKIRWLESVFEANADILQSGVSKRSYSKSNLPRWIEILSLWADSPTYNYAIPNELAKFTQTELNSKTESDNIAPSHPLFTEIEEFLSHSFNLRNFILFDIVNLVWQQVKAEKAKLAQIGFDDLLYNLQQALQGQNRDILTTQILQQYPVAMIDEFQDTDPVQYQIFDTIYHDRQQSGLLFIGDPKQAIYSFRGADIFTYIEAKKSVDYQFTMATNWRSSAHMVNGVNGLFRHKHHPFIFDEIPFIAMNSAAKNGHKGFYVDGHEVNAIQSYLLPESVTSNSDYLEFSAEYCAQQITTWLASDAYFSNADAKKDKIKSADIAILVRTGREAEIIQQKLSKRNIKSVYLSNHKSVFASLEAREMLRILQAVLTPTNENYLRSALATQLIGMSMSDIDLLSAETNKLELIIDEFREYQALWLRYGVLVTLRRLMNHRQLIENLLSLPDGERIITNFMHLGELLQEMTQELDTPHALIRWLTKQINEPDRNLENHEQRLESDDNLISIITIHKAKGLEYPIVFLPFIALHRESDSMIFHDRKNYTSNYAYNVSSDIKSLIEQERLAEDLRLLYVALTRSIYHCSFSIAGLKKGKGNQLAVQHSALGYLLLTPEQNDYTALAHSLHQLVNTTVVNVELPIPVSTLIPSQQASMEHLAANVFKRKLDYNWRVTSYSGLLQSTHYTNNKSAALLRDILPSFDIEVLADNNRATNDAMINSQDNVVIYDIHHFPKGAIVGTLMHECFENSDFTHPDSQNIADHLVTKLNLQQTWLMPLSEWFLGVLKAPLSDNLSLSDLSANQRLNELQFYLPIRQDITSARLDRVCKHYDPLSQQCAELEFSTVQGMLKGFIDMVFEWQGKYYIADYKSNYLGHSIEDYNHQAITLAMCEHRYDLQYQLYSLALHRYLTSRLPHYQYQVHFGGVYYLFVRGMVPDDSQHGIFYTKPSLNFIKELDQLFG
ncbi:exodeoxyribonuclease V subunit beta [Orbus sturtevantii]|uniref:exodeoxyribonuclease V subunit beta n=1 Tax=Orbus sturtevantii TaxID=3074109 RepID=UPI00370D5E30